MPSQSLGIDEKRGRGAQYHVSRDDGGFAEEGDASLSRCLDTDSKKNREPSHFLIHTTTHVPVK